MTKKEKSSIYRWVEPETVIIDENGKRVTIPEHQEEGQYVEEASIPGYVICLWNGKKHLVNSEDVVVIM